MERRLNFEEEPNSGKSNLPTDISLWRKVVNKLMSVLTIIAAVLAVAFLIFILADVFLKGVPAVSLAFLTHLPTGPTFKGGGIAPDIQGSFIMVGIASLISIPIGVGAGIFFSEWSSSKLSMVSGFMNDVLTGFPTMVIGLFVFLIIVLGSKHFSAFAGGFALSIIMIPIIARTTNESLKLVPTTLREASMSLGVPRWKTILRIVVGTGKTGLVTGVMLAIARAMGETAPLLFTAFSNNHFITNIFNQPTGSMTVLIYDYGTSVYASWITQAWATALVLILIMLVLNILARLIAGRNLKPIRME